ncbi:MAG: SET domain-containing protein-lysine N-methyltransferase [Planctomycetaceae bacterium]|nr:SET domain-containing protein-lysine N-methyltransferase [Planctomycetaceae bacterium]
MPFSQSELLEVRYTKEKGRAVFARCPIKKGTILEKVPCIIVRWEDIEDSELAHYVYTWTEKTVAVALGYGSLYNHSFNPNARYDDLRRQAKVYTAIRDIAAGEEITINYNGDPKDKTNEFDFEILD